MAFCIPSLQRCRVSFHGKNLVMILPNLRSVCLCSFQTISSLRQQVKALRGLGFSPAFFSATASSHSCWAPSSWGTTPHTAGWIPKAFPSGSAVRGLLSWIQAGLGWGPCPGFPCQCSLVIPLQLAFLFFFSLAFLPGYRWRDLLCLLSLKLQRWWPVRHTADASVASNVDLYIQMTE